MWWGGWATTVSAPCRRRAWPDLKHGFFNLPPLSVFRDIFLRHVNCHRAVRHGGDHLTEGLRPHVAHGVNAGNTGFRGLSGHDIAAAVQLQLTHRQRRGGLSAHADKYAVAVHHAFLTGDGVPQADAGQPVPGKQRGNDAVPTEFHIFGLCQRLVIDFGGPQGVSAVDEDHFFRHAAEKEGICRGGIAAAHHDHRFALVKHPVAGGAVGHAPAQQLRLSGNAQRSGFCAGVEELLNSMQEFKERVDAEIRGGERPEEEEATIEEWLQNMMLMTDMDQDDPDSKNKVTLMTVHSAKGLEYKYVYIVGLEENLFPSQRAAESPDGIEEERRLFYVALTRAKVSATISYAEMRFKWGNMEFSRPSCFLREIDPRYIESDADFAETRPQRRPGDDGPAAIDELRRRFDYRFQQKQQGGGRFGGGGNGGSGGYGSRSGSGGGFGRAADGESGPARRFARAAESRRPAAAPDPALVQTPRPSTDGMRRVGVRQAMDGGLSSGSAAAVSGEYVVGQRVEHPKFGVGIVQRIETLSTDHKLVVAFDNAGEKTLLAKFAKLTKL